MRITVIAVGKLKETYFTDAVLEYAKRLSKYCKLDIVELMDEKTPDKASFAEEEQIRQKEGERIKKALKDDAYIIALVIEGKQLDSIAFSKKMDELKVRGNSHIIFLIGGSLGLSKEIQRQADFLLSFSQMTFPHQLMRVILLEQIYRSYRISNGEPYHK